MQPFSLTPRLYLDGGIVKEEGRSTRHYQQLTPAAPKP